MPWELLWWWRVCSVPATTSVPTTPTSSLVRTIVSLLRLDMVTVVFTFVRISSLKRVLALSSCHFKGRWGFLALVCISSLCGYIFTASASFLSFCCKICECIIFLSLCLFTLSPGLKKVQVACGTFELFSSLQTPPSCTWLLDCVCWSSIRRDTRTSTRALTPLTPASLLSSSFLCWEW